MSISFSFRDDIVDQFHPLELRNKPFLNYPFYILHDLLARDRFKPIAKTRVFCLCPHETIVIITIIFVCIRHLEAEA